MIYRSALRFLFSSVLLFSNLVLAEPVYKVMTEEFSPIGFYQEDGRLTGVGVELTRLLLEAVGHPDNIQVLPWARAVKNIDHKPNHILFAMARTAEREMKYQWVGPLFSDSVYLFQLKDNSTVYNSFERARHAEFIAVTRDFPEQIFLEDLNFSNLILTNSPKQSVKMLMTARVPLMVSGAAVMDDLVKNTGYDPANIKRTRLKIYSTDLYLAFSSNIPKQEVKRWQIALDKIKKQDDYQKILANYHFD